MSLREFALDELRRAGLFDKDGDYGGMIGDAVMRLVDAFIEDGHSGMSASLAIQAFERIARFEPLTPLQGTDEEWMEVGDGVFQNRRCPHVFRENGEAYDAEAVVFREPSGACFTSAKSRRTITFPYVPSREYVSVEAAQ